jgi:hypothetical protein
MTLPFRRRHHDDESAHDRARAIVAAGLFESVDAQDAAWLDVHLAGCAECVQEREAYLADHQLLQALRQSDITPPRDLWARTSAALDAERRRDRTFERFVGTPAQRRRTIPLGVLSGVLVALVVVATSLVPRPPSTALATPPGSSVSGTASAPGPTQIIVTADSVGWIQANPDGTYSLISADVDEVCPPERSGCAPLQNESPSPLNLGAQPQALVLSPGHDQLAVVGSDANQAGSVFIVTVPQSQPTSPPPTLPTTSNPATEPPASNAASPGVSVEPSAGIGHAIVTGVSVVGAAAYSADGAWFAFSARPLVGDQGPDLYVWHVGDDQARKVSDNGSTYFSGWLGNRILASGVLEVVTNAPLTGPSTNPSAGSVPPEEHPFSFLLDPATGERLDFATPDVWLPTVDPTGRFVVYWSGTIVSGDGGPGRRVGQEADWRLATGHLVVDGWTEPVDKPAASGEPSASKLPTSSPAETATPVGPAGHPVELVPGPIAGFDAQFDPTGSRLGVWVADSADAKVGLLRLVVLDPLTGTINDAVQPLPGEPALRGYSIETGRLAWVSPPGQDGQQSSVRVLAWNGDDFGQIRTIAGDQVVIVR